MGELTALITGGKGNVGSHIALAFLDGAELQGQKVKPVLFDNLSTGHEETLDGMCEFIPGDLTNPYDIRAAFSKHDFDIVIHCGAALVVPESVVDPRKYWHNNTIGSINLADAMAEHGVKNLVFSATAAAYGTPTRVPITEDMVPNPINPYGDSKVAVERVFLNYGIAYGLNVVIFRYFNVAGSDPEARIGEHHTPNETHLIPRVVMDLMVGNPISIYGGEYAIPPGDWVDDGTCVRDYIHMDDLVGAHLLGGNAAIDGIPNGQNIYNLGSRKGYSVKQVVQAAIDILGGEHKVWISEARTGDPPILVADSTAAREKLGWEPYYGLADMIEHTHAFLKTERGGRILEEWRAQRAKELEPYLRGEKEYREEVWRAVA